jgi:hypothetical protein
LLAAALAAVLLAAGFFIKGRLLDPSRINDVDPPRQTTAPKPTPPLEAPNPVEPGPKAATEPIELIPTPPNATPPDPTEATPVPEPTGNKGYGKRGGRGGKDQDD